MTPISSSSGKKRRVTPSNSGARCAPKSTRIDLKKISEKSMENALDDKVVSSTCEVECSSAISLSTTPKTLPSRSSLDYFVHTTQKLEVTTSSTDGDLVDLTAEDESASEAVALLSTGILAETNSADAMPATSCDEVARKVSVPTAAECNTENATQLTSVEPADIAELNDKSKKDSCTNNLEVGEEVGCSQLKDTQNLASSITDGSDCAPDVGSVGSTCATVPGSQEVDANAATLLDGHKTKNDDPVSQNTADCAIESPLDKSSSYSADDDIEMVESPACDNNNKTDVKLGQATVVLTRVDKESGKASSCAEKSEISTASVNVTPPINSKPKVRKFTYMTLFLCYDFYSQLIICL